MSLQTILATLYTRANSLPGTTATQTLQHGLKLEVWREGSELYLQLSRADVFPSPAEWKTTAARWPVAAQSDPVKRVANNRFCLVSAMPPIAPLFELPVQRSIET